MLNKAVLIGILVAGLLFTVDYSDIGVCDNCGDLARLEGFRLNLAEDGMNMYVELCPDCVQEALDSRQIRAKLNMHYCQCCGIDGAERVIDPMTGEVLGYYCNDCFIEGRTNN